MLERYFQEELTRLRELAKDFSQAHPALAPYLSGPSSDPDVERLLEGVAFLTGMLRQKLDDEFPEIVNELMDLIWPHYLRPIPCTSIVAFKPKPGLKETLTVTKGTGLASIPVEETSCLFRTCYDLTVHPFKVTNAKYTEKPGQPVELRILLQSEGPTIREWNLTNLDLYLAGDYATACDLYHLLCTGVIQVIIHPQDGGQDLVLPPSSIKPIGFHENNAFLSYPSNSFPGYRIIQEYFINPRKFLFLRLDGLESWTNRGEGSRLEIVFQLKQRTDPFPTVDENAFVLSAVPVVNIFPAHAQPVQVDHRSFKYPLRVAAVNPTHYHIYSVKSVTGLVQGTAEERRYQPFNLFQAGDQDTQFYTITKQPSLSGFGMDWYISVSYSKMSDTLQQEILSVDLFCTNGILPEQLQIGDICMPTSTTPELVEFKNITTVSPYSPPALGKNLLWRLISHLNLNYQSIANAENLKTLLRLYVPADLRDKKQWAAALKQIQGVEEVKPKNVDRLISGLPLRGLDIMVKVKQNHFASKGDLYLFGSILERFLANYAALNSFVCVSLEESFSGERYKWPPRTGDRLLL